MLLFVRWEDLVVGAPQYFEKEGEIGGAVYVYVNNAGMWDNVTPVRIDGPKDSMFGLAVANLGDINQDGYHGKAATLVLRLVGLHGGFKKVSIFGSDFAVGAPNDNQGRGKVFIYHGSKTGLKSKKAGQVWWKSRGIFGFIGSQPGQFRRDLRLTPGSGRNARCQNVRLLFGKQHGLRRELLP